MTKCTRWKSVLRGVILRFLALGLAISGTGLGGFGTRCRSICAWEDCGGPVSLSMFFAFIERVEVAVNFGSLIKWLPCLHHFPKLAFPLSVLRNCNLSVYPTPLPIYPKAI